MRSLDIPIFIFATTIILTGASASAFVNAQGQQGTQSFSGNLSGKNEKPPTESNSTGTADFSVNENNSEMSYKMNITGIKKISQATIRNGSEGENGAILVILFKSKSAEGDETPPKIDVSGKITKDDLRGPLKGKDLSDLVSLINKRGAYANIQTEKYPKGAIRAQLAASEGMAAVNETTSPSNVTETNATTAPTSNESSVTPPTLTPAPTMEQTPTTNVSETNATNATNATSASLTTGAMNETASKPSEFPSNQSTNAPNLDIDESMR